jgi:hypothetical protein
VVDYHEFIERVVIDNVIKAPYKMNAEEAVCHYLALGTVLLCFINVVVLFIVSFGARNTVVPTEAQIRLST